MPPKKSAAKAQKSSKSEQRNKQAPNDDTKTKAEPDAKDTDAATVEMSEENAETNGVGDSKPASKKRKTKATDTEPQKAQRRSGRGGGNAQPTQEQLLKYLLSKDAEDLTRPDDEAEDIEQRGHIRTYSSTALNPFEELMCAIILSRPISHRLGLRTIRTVLNDPYNFTSAKAVKDAGSDKQHQALWDARTQHKDKTAEQLGQLANVVLDKFTATGDKDGKELGEVLDKVNEDVREAHDLLKESIKGLGKTGMDIFFRRVQWLWQEVYPFVDGRTDDSLRKFGFAQGATELEELISKHWKKLSTGNLAGSNEAEKKRRAFVIVLERAIGADLEGKVEAVVNAAVS